MRSLRLWLVISLCSVMAGVGGCRRADPAPAVPKIAAANSYLAAAADELCGPGSSLLCLVPAGMCPAHFDISASQLEQLRKCRILLIFDFQKRLAKSLGRLDDKAVRTEVITESGGLCIPQTYLAVCKVVCRLLCAEYPEHRELYLQRLQAIEQRIARLERSLLDKMAGAGLVGEKVLVSNHQAQFARWLGLDVLASFGSTDTETPGGIQRCLERAAGQQVRFVIANKQQGTRLAEALAHRLQARLVVFSNFPSLDHGSRAFDALVDGNVEALLEASGR